MVAVVAQSPLQAPPLPAVPASAPMRAPRRPRIAFVGADDPRVQPRRTTALKAWLIKDDESLRAWALDLSETGARVGGTGYRWAMGERLLFKVLLDPAEPALIVRAKVVRLGDNEVGLKFLEVNFDDWFRLGRYVDRG
jgi:hypothetical protein